jgi:hypothetical protein
MEASMKTYRVMLIEQVNGEWEGQENIREIIEFEADGQRIRTDEHANIFQILEDVKADIERESEAASQEPPSAMDRTMPR